MKLSTFFREVGHPIAYHPKLNNITGSALATIFISQFLYWEGKQRDPDGWIYKTQVEIQEETGLSRREQETARKQLKSAGLLKERRRGLPARLEFLPVLEEFDRQWELYLESGGSIALAENQQKNQQKTKHLRKQNSQKQASNPHGCQIVQSGQTRASALDNLERPDRTDNLYTETTNRDYLPKTTSNQAPKAFLQNASRVVDLEEEDLAKKKLNNPVSAAPVNQTSGAIGQNSKKDNSSPISPKKEKQTKFAFRYDHYGVIQFPTASRCRLPSILTMRSMQFLLAQQLDCEFAVDANEMVWIADPMMGEWLTEDEMFGGGPDGEQGHLSLKKMVSILSGDTAPSQLNIDWFNEAAKRYFRFWQSQCQRLDQDAMDVIRQKSVCLWLQQLDPYFDIEILDFDEVA